MDVGDLTSTATEAISNITDSGVAASVGTAAVTGSPMLAPLAGLFATTYGQCAVENFLDDAEGALRNYSEQNKKEDQPSAALTKLSVGMADVISLASSTDGPEDPEKLETLMKELLEDESRRDDVERIEQTLAAIFHGDVEPPSGVNIGDNPESVFDTMQEVFNTTDHQEALQMFLLYEEVIGGLRGHFDGNDDDAAQILEDSQMKMDEWHQTLIDKVIERDVKSQGFDILTTRQFKKKVPFPNESEPISGWIRGYKWPDLMTTNDNGHHYYFERPAPDNYLQTREPDGIIDKQKGETPASETVVDALINQIRNRGNLLLHGRPGSGKSHICQRVAVEWFNTHNYGEVYYRKGSSENPIDKYYKQIKEAIRRSRDVGDGHVLVVVEDATREEAKKIFDLIAGYRNSQSANVSFLLDSRTSEWDRYVENSRKDWIDVDGSESLAVTNVPPVTKSDCENAIETFNATVKKGWYRGSAQSLYNTISEDYSTEGRGELLVLANEIVRESDYDGDLPLTYDASKVHSGTTDNRGLIELVDEGGSEAPMFYKLAVGIATLTAAEIPIRPALLYSLGDKKSEYRRINDLLNGKKTFNNGAIKLPVPIRGVFIFPGSNSQLYTPRHALWGEAFLDDGINDDLRPDHKLHETFIHVVNQFTSLAEDDSKRRLIKHILLDQGRSEFEYLDRFEKEGPEEVVNELLNNIYDFGERNSQSERDSTFVSLFEGTAFIDPISESVPKACSPILEFKLRLRYAKIVEYTDKYENPSGKCPIEIIEEIRSDADNQLDSLKYGHIEIKSYLTLYELYDNTEYVKQAVQQADTIDVKKLPIDFLIKLTSVLVRTAPWTEIKNIYNTAVDAATEINNPVVRSNKYHSLLKAATRSVSWENIVDAYDEAITAARQIDDPETRADTLNFLIRTAVRETEWENIVDAYDDAITAARQIDDPETRADSLGSLLSTAVLSTEWENIVDTYDEAITAARQIDDPETKTDTLDFLLSTAVRETEWENIVDAYAEVVTAARQIDDPETRADTLDFLLRTVVGETEWENIDDAYNEAVTAARQIDDPETRVGMFNSLVFNTIGIEWENIDDAYNEAVTAARQIDNPEARVDTLNFLLSVAVISTEWENIVDAYDESITAARQIDSPETKADMLDYLLSTAVGETGWENIVDAYDESITAARQIDTPETKADMLESLLSTAVRETEWENIADAYDDAITTARQIDTPETKADMLESLLSTAVGETEWENIADAYDDAITAARQIDDPETKVDTLGSLLSTAVRETEWENIVDAYDEAITSARQIDDPETKVDTLGSLLSTAVGETEWENIVDAYDEAIIAAKQIYDPKTKVKKHDYLLSAAIRETEWENIVDAYNEAITAARQIDNPETKANMIYGLLSTVVGETEWENIVDAYDEAITTARRIDNPRTDNPSLDLLIYECDRIEEEIEQTKFNKHELDQVRKIRSEHFN